MPSDSPRLPSLLLAMLLCGCGKGKPGPEKRPAEASHASRALGAEEVATPEALFDTVRARAWRGDTLGLARLLVDDSVFRRNVYPLSPAFDSTRESIFEFVLNMHKANSTKGLRRLLYDVTLQPGAAPLRLPVAKSEKTLEGTLYIPAAYSGKAPGIQLFGAVLCRAGGCQVLSYAPAGAKGQ